MSKKKIRRHYELRIRDDAPGYRAADWSDRRAQELRFEVLVNNVALNGRSLLDVGCGTGDLWDFLRKRGIQADYLGVDLLDKMIEAACKRHPDARFLAIDIFQPDSLPGELFDVVFASGVFNLDVGNNRDFLPRAIARLIELSADTTVFNLLHARADVRHGHCVYWQPEDIRAMLTDFPGDVKALDDYLLNDFTVICRKR